MDRLNRVIRIVLLTLALEAVMIGLAYGWVAIYAYLIHPGETEAFYTAYAQVASPVVSLVAGPIVFGLAAYLLVRRRADRGREVWWVLAAYLALDVLIVLTVAQDVASNLLIWIPNALTKTAGVWVGRTAARSRHA